MVKNYFSFLNDFITDLFYTCPDTHVSRDCDVPACNNGFIVILFMYFLQHEPNRLINSTHSQSRLITCEKNTCKDTFSVLLRNRWNSDTGSCCGVHFHFLRRLSVRRRGGKDSVVVSGGPSSARAAARVARLSRSISNLSSPAGITNYQILNEVWHNVAFT